MRNGANENLNDTQNKNNEKKYNKNEKEEDNEIIIELEIINDDDEEINILCNKDKLNEVKT